MAIAPLIVRVQATGTAALARTSAAIRALATSVSSAARTTATRATPAFNRLTAVLRAVASAALRAAIVIGGPLRRALNAAARGARDLAQTVGMLLLRWVAIGAAVAPFVFALGNVFANLLPLVLHLAPALFAAGSALAVLKLGFEGVGGALEAGLSGDVKEFNKELKKLAPTAQEVVRKLVALAPLWRSLRGEIQQHLFKGVAQEIQGLSNTYFPILTQSLLTTSNHFNKFFRDVAAGLAAPDTARKMSRIFEGANNFIFGALVAVRKLGRAFLDIAEVAAKPFGELGANIGIAATKFADWIRKLANDGTLARWMAQAKETFGQLMDIGKEIGRVLGAIFRGTDEGGFLENLRNSLDELADFLEGDDGQEMIEFFSDVANAAAGLIRTIGDVVRWFQEGIAILRDLFGQGEDGANNMGAAFRGIGNAFGWIGGIMGSLGGLVGAVRNAVSGINNALSALRTTVFIDIITRNSVQGVARPINTGGGGGGGSTFKARARGGPVTAGMPYIVGEHRPELFVPNQSGRVLPSVPTGTGGPSWSGSMTGLDALFFRWLQKAVRTGQLRLT